MRLSVPLFPPPDIYSMAELRSWGLSQSLGRPQTSVCMRVLPLDHQMQFEIRKIVWRVHAMAHLASWDVLPAPSLSPTSFALASASCFSLTRASSAACTMSGRLLIFFIFGSCFFCKITGAARITSRLSNDHIRTGSKDRVASFSRPRIYEIMLVVSQRDRA